MKRSVMCLLLVAGAYGVLVADEPSTNPVELTPQKLELIEENLVIGLVSDIPSLQASAALVLHQIKELAPQYDFSLTVIPLMRIVRHSGYDETARLAGGLALHGLKSARGDYAIARIAKFEDNPRVKKAFTAMSYESGFQNELN